MSRLIKVKQLEKYEVAIQTIIKGNIRCVVVESNQIATELFTRKALRGHENIVPLNKIQGRLVDWKIVEELKQKYDNQIELAINLLEFDDKFRPAVAWIFGNVFVTSNKQIAKEVAHGTGKYKFNCVTLDGDEYNIRGLLTGGSQRSGPILGKIQELLQFDSQM